MQAESAGEPAPPPEIEEIIRKLPLRVGLYVPDDILQDWFSPRERSGAAGQTGEEAAQAFAQRTGCEFQYDSERGEGVFWKWVPAM